MLACQPANIKNESRIKYYLDIWKDYMLRPDNNLGYPKKSAYCRSSSLASFEDMADQIDYTDARAMDAIISGLPMSQQIAVNHFCLASVWRSSRESLEETYQRALVSIERGLNARGMA